MSNPLIIQLLLFIIELSLLFKELISCYMNTFDVCPLSSSRCLVLLLYLLHHHDHQHDYGISIIYHHWKEIQLFQCQPVPRILIMFFYSPFILNKTIVY